MGPVLAWIVTVGSLAALLGAVAWVLLGRRQAGGPGGHSERFSLDRYQPMERLLAEEDLLFLKAQPGFRPEIGARWKRERRRIFRLYLNELKSDFRRMHAQARELVAHSGADSADLVEVLMKQQITFQWATAALEVRLALQQVGIGKLDVAPLIELIEAMRLDLAQRTGPLAA